MRHIGIVVAMCAILVAASVDAAGKKAKQGEVDPKEKAAAMYREGVTAYDAGKFAEALAAFTEAYNLSQETGLLFNLGVCSEKTGDPEKAAAYYSLYLEEMPYAEDAAEVQARLDAIRGVAVEEAPTAEPPPATELVPLPPEPTAEGTGGGDDGASRTKHVGPALAIGLGGLAVATGAITAIMAYKGYGDLDASCAPGCSDGEVDRVRGTAIAADIQLGVGLAAVAAGIVWLLADMHREKASAAIEVSALPFPSDAGGGLAVEGRF